MDLLLVEEERAPELLDLVSLGDFHDEEDYEGDDYECKERVCEVSVSLNVYFRIHI